MRRTLILLTSLAFLGVVAFGAHLAAEAHGVRGVERQEALDNARFGRSDTVAGTTTTLPPGMHVDPATGTLVVSRIEVGAGVRPVPWKTLRTYEYRRGLEDLPDAIRDLDGQRVAMLGFLWIIYDYDDIRRFGLAGNHWSCCYGIPPGLSDVVIVTLAEDQEGLSQTLNPIRVEGTFHVKEIQQGGFTTAIYQISDAQVSIIDY